jgi:hypothetical protein
VRSAHTLIATLRLGGGGRAAAVRAAEARKLLSDTAAPWGRSIHGQNILSMDGCTLRQHDESLRHIWRPAGLVSEPRGDLTCRGVEGPKKHDIHTFHDLCLLCICPAGFVGVNCGMAVAPPSPPPAANGCATMPCQNGGMCQSMGSGYSCICPAGFVGVNCGMASGGH